MPGEAQRGLAHLRRSLSRVSHSSLIRHGPTRASQTPHALGDNTLERVSQVVQRVHILALILALSNDPNKLTHGIGN
jgi:hypothetical protein